MAKYYQELKVWQKSMKLVTHVYKLTASFPKEELYGLTSQIRRAVISLPCNIAEGATRETTKDFLRFISISQGSQLLNWKPSFLSQRILDLLRQMRLTPLNYTWMK